MNIFDKRACTHTQSDLMVDIETLGTTAGSIVLSIGAVIFNPFTLSGFDELREQAFYVNIDRDNAAHLGFTADPSTLDWWAKQDPAAWAALQTDPKPVREAINAFANFALNHPLRISHVWAKSPSFDCVLLQALYQKFDQRFPIPFFAWRDVRTAEHFAWCGEETPKFFGPEGLAHDARDDAVAQALSIQRAHYRLGLSLDAGSTRDFLCDLPPTE